MRHEDLPTDCGGEAKVIVIDRILPQHLGVGTIVRRRAPRTVLTLTWELVDGALDITGRNFQQRMGGHGRIVDLGVAHRMTVGIHVGQSRRSARTSPTLRRPR